MLSIHFDMNTGNGFLFDSLHSIGSTCTSKLSLFNESGKTGFLVSQVMPSSKKLRSFQLAYII